MGVDNAYTMFKKSRPYGYYPPDVEKRIAQYEKALSDVNEKYIQKDQDNKRLQNRIEDLESQLRAVHLELSNLEVREVSEVVAASVLEDFKKVNTPKSEIPETPLEDASDIQIDIATATYDGNNGRNVESYDSSSNTEQEFIIVE